MCRPRLQDCTYTSQQRYQDTWEYSPLSWWSNSPPSAHPVFISSRSPETSWLPLSLTVFLFSTTRRDFLSLNTSGLLVFVSGRLDASRHRQLSSSVILCTGWNQQPTSVRSVRTDTWRQIKLSPFSFCCIGVNTRKQDETEEETTGTEHVPSQLSLFWTHWSFPVKHWRTRSTRSYWSCFLWLIWSVIVLLLARHTGTRTTKRFSWRLQPQPAGGRRDGRKQGREKEGWGWRDEEDDRRRKTRKSGGKEVTWRREER